MTVKLKYCGLKQKSEIELACQLKLDAIGLVFVEKSVRCVVVEEAAELSAYLRSIDSVNKPRLVALFVNPEVSFVQKVIDDVRPDVLQFHGQETETFCQQFKLPYWKAIAMLDGLPWQEQVSRYQTAEYFLLDAYQSGQLGGGGEAFDWFELPLNLRDKLILAGGLNLDNVQQALQQTQTIYLDVSSGIESKRGVKSPILMKQFMQLVNPS